MRLIGAILILICSTPVPAAELPSRKPGLWEVKMSIDGRNAPPQTVQQCIDASTDQLMQSSAGPYSPAICPKREVQTVENSITIDSSCTFGGKPATTHAVITGSLDSAYTLAVTAQSEDLPGGKMVMTIQAQRLGACTADQKPGDMIFSNGMKINILEAQKQVPSPGVSLPPQPPPP